MLQDLVEGILEFLPFLLVAKGAYESPEVLDSLVHCWVRVDVLFERAHGVFNCARICHGVALQQLCQYRYGVVVVPLLPQVRDRLLQTEQERFTLVAL